MLLRLKSFSLSAKETQGVDLLEADVCGGLEEESRSLIGKIFGEKRTNFWGVKSAMMKLWNQKGLCKVISLAPNTYQFIFNNADDKKVCYRVDRGSLIIIYWSWCHERRIKAGRIIASMFPFFGFRYGIYQIIGCQ